MMSPGNQSLPTMPNGHHDKGENEDSRSTVVSQAKELLLVFVPRPLKDVVEKGLLKFFLYLVLIFVVFPPVIAFLAAFWLKLLGGSNIELIHALRNAYLEVIQDGFSFEEVATRSNKRLDYFQWLQADLRPGSATPRVYRISIQSRQKAILTLQTVALVKSPNEKCSLSEDDIDLVSVKLGGQPVGTPLRQLVNSNNPILIGVNWWERNLKNFDMDDLIQQLSFHLTETASKLTCGYVHVEGSISVFKDLL